MALCLIWFGLKVPLDCAIQFLRYLERQLGTQISLYHTFSMVGCTFVYWWCSVYTVHTLFNVKLASGIYGCFFLFLSQWKMHFLKLYSRICVRTYFSKWKIKQQNSLIKIKVAMLHKPHTWKIHLLNYIEWMIIW